MLQCDNVTIALFLELTEGEEPRSILQWPHGSIPIITDNGYLDRLSFILGFTL